MAETDDNRAPDPEIDFGKWTPETFKANTIERNGCWEWQGSKGGGWGGRYGQMSGINSKDRYAHRFSYRLFHGPIPDGMLVRHLCNNFICVNPEHLAVGTLSDNQQDSLRAGTAAVGERNGHCRFSSTAVQNVKDLYAQGLTRYEIAWVTGIPYYTVASYINGKRRGYGK